MKTLHLNLKRKWFDMILAGEKKEEYRDLTSYWESRFIRPIPGEPEEFNFSFFDTVTFSNGYAKDRPQFTIELKLILIGHGRSEWGAEEDKEYFVLRLGRILSSR
ncbi:MAG: hypothetical protein RI601_12335 [Desulfurivibrionaceae bacterium]|nr:hypothetical protein [Desulfurivibrionaceae bacterium]